MIPRIGLQSGFAGAFKKYRQLHEILIRKSVRSVVGHRGRLCQIRGGEFRRQGMKFEDEQAEPANVRRPAAQMPHQIFFQFIARNLISEVSECAGGLSRPRSPDIVRRRQIRPVVIQKRAHVKQVVHVMPKRLEIAGQ